MSTNATETMTAEEQVLFTAMTERMRQLRRRHGVPDGVSLADAVTLHLLSAKDVEDARWGNTTTGAPRTNPSPS